MRTCGALGLAFAACLNAEAQTFESIARSGDPVPGRPGAVFRAVFANNDLSDGFSRPSINNRGDIVFRAVSDLPSPGSDRADGVYAKPAGLSAPLAVLADTTAAFSVPGAPAGTRFTAFSAPLINDRGDVVFRGQFGSQSGFFATTTAGGPALTRIVGTGDAAPAPIGDTFSSFSAGSAPIWITLNDNGDVAFLARFLRSSIVQTGLFSRSVAGGPIVRIADNTSTFGITNPPTAVAISGLSDLRPPALNNRVGGNPARVIFEGTLSGLFGSRVGLLTAPIDGSTLPYLQAWQDLNTSATAFSAGGARTFSSVFLYHDINDGNQIIFQHDFTDGVHALMAGNVGSPMTTLTSVADTAGGDTIPGRGSATFGNVFYAAINEAGQVAGFAGDGLGTIQGLYWTNLAGSPMLRVADEATIPPGGYVAPARFLNFNDTSAAINNAGNLVLAPTAIDQAGINLLGLYFWDEPDLPSNPNGTLVRVFDKNTSAVDLGGMFNFGAGQTRAVRVYQGTDVKAGGFRSINDCDEIGFLAVFSSDDGGVYIARMGGSAGQIAITCPPNATVPCGGDTSPAATGMATALDTCSQAPVVPTYSDAFTSACGTTGTIRRTWSASGSGQPVTCVQTITIVDTTAPVLSGVPANATFECSAVPGPATVTASDACTGTVPVTFNESRLDGNCPGNYTLTRTWSAGDACGNTISRNQIITVVDTTPPVLAGVPADATVECNAVPSPAAVTASDACAGGVPANFSETRLDGNCPGRYTLTRVWSATDPCGRNATATQTITVRDTTPPIVTPPPDVLNLPCGSSTEPSIRGTATAMDNCDSALAPPSYEDNVVFESCLFGIITTRTWTAIDACGNAGTAVQVIHIDTSSDGTPPTLTCPADIEVTADPGSCSASGLNLGSAIGVDLCTTTTITNNAPAVFPVGPTIVTWTAVDECGNAAACTQLVTVHEAGAPLVTCSVGTTMLWPPNHNLVDVALEVDVNDECDSGVSPTITVYADEDDEETTGDGAHSPDAKDLAPGTLRLRAERKGDSNGRVYLIVVTATDISGNVGQCICTVVVPHSRSGASLNSVAAQACAAQDYFLDNSAPPPGFVVVGDGPIIGPKQ